MWKIKFGNERRKICYFFSQKQVSSRLISLLFLHCSNKFFPFCAKSEFFSVNDKKFQVFLCCTRCYMKICIRMWRSNRSFFIHVNASLYYLLNVEKIWFRTLREWKIEEFFFFRFFCWLCKKWKRKMFMRSSMRLFTFHLIAKANGLNFYYCSSD